MNSVFREPPPFVRTYEGQRPCIPRPVMAELLFRIFYGTPSRWQRLRRRFRNRARSVRSLL